MIYVDNALLGMALLCFAYTLFLRWRTSSLWLFRLVNTSGGRESKYFGFLSTSPDTDNRLLYAQHNEHIFPGLDTLRSSRDT